MSAPTLCSQLIAAFGFAWLFVIFAATHFFFDAASLYQFSKTSDRFLDRFSVANY